ncbi:MAG: amino acid permease [Wenzhouxiangellaceae bacterium]|nr:amino acid permease [Wenzhouxiangellaceae bacterium]MBS3824821.1 amino acid permease [Wenzhouxiangellaceae bacterium]
MSALQDVDDGHDERPALKRAIGFPLLVLYGIGTMVGAGFFALSGEVAGKAGTHAPVAFGVAGLLALFSALAFAEWSSRLPHAGGSARYLEQAFGRRWLSAIVGWLIITTGVVSAATLVVATDRFLGDFVDWPDAPAIIAVTLAIGGIAAWGVREAVGLVVGICVVQIATLMYVAFASFGAPEPVAAGPMTLMPPLAGSAWISILSAAFLAFYAFIGFEDMVNMAEETQHARRNMPWAVVLSLVLTTILYMFVSTALVLSIPSATLAEAGTPLAEAVRHHGRPAIAAIGIVSILSAVNSALVQIVMAARVAYGMANRGYAPGFLATIGRRTQTPWIATALATLAIALLALGLELTTLANITSGVLLLVFAMVNAGLWWTKGLEKDRPSPAAFTLPRSVPLLGTAVSVSALVFKLVTSL